MKKFTIEEKDAARKKLPKPLQVFAGSKTIANLYLGIVQKHTLNLRQAGVMTELITNILFGLEPESGLETALHQDLPELSNATARELVADINDRIFKEARRRVEQNIVEYDDWTRYMEQTPISEEEAAELRAKTVEEKDDDNPAVIAEDELELQKAIEQDRKEKEAAQRELAEIEARNKRKAAEVGNTPAVPTLPAQNTLGKEQPKAAEPEVVVRNIAAEKLKAPVTQGAEIASSQMTPPPTPPTPPVSLVQTPAPAPQIPPPAPKTGYSADPYREHPE